MNKTQDEVNQVEWNNPNNWSTIYFSKRDSRQWVPKRNPTYGATINFGNPFGSRWIYYLFLLFLMLGAFFGAVVSFIVMNIDL